MATGSGKTITALHLACRLNDAVGPGLAVVIVAPFIHLVDQWIGVAHRYGLRPTRCAEGISNWQAEVGAGIQALNSGHRGVFSIATTAATLTSAALRSLLETIRKPFLLIADEAHNYGATNLAAALPESASYRVGLSATPSRWLDPDGTQRLQQYFGDVVTRFGLAEAIAQNVLTPYRYYPNLVPFDDQEFEAYLDLTRLLSRYLSQDADGLTASGPGKTLLLKRARLVASAKGKIPFLRQLLEPARRDDHILVYCGDGTVEGPTPSEVTRQVEAVTRMLGEDLGMRCAAYTAETSPSRRTELLEEFDRGFIQALVAIRCLDEGVDVPSTRSAYIRGEEYIVERSHELRRDHRRHHRRDDPRPHGRVRRAALRR
jgi:superfamily II DNA or RNA helicase